MTWKEEEEEKNLPHVPHVADSFFFFFFSFHSFLFFEDLDEPKFVADYMLQIFFSFFFFEELDEPKFLSSIFFSFQIFFFYSRQHKFDQEIFMTSHITLMKSNNVKLYKKQFLSLWLSQHPTNLDCLLHSTYRNCFI